ncbi:predicted protein [Aspergillus terreus NIH2624]|uniref:Uncharacterized protein n=1 Tax=Aspergillus terreus (strain NIH 2624 / FGSC A1156) TaxID=341663 RepID=Q0D072_ASPTN|nr:uncharacterized protein ATEG_00662 [Aspergillus terreus NIH2624]EAU39308.1 predicted protein [Aspergillus terreus NIH2624]
MSFGRLQAALAAATSDITLAAASLNFDFTLVKIEAPKEYHSLGSALSKTSKEQAEFGSAHITARRLGALFEEICPSTPKLIKAYGTRVSEIAEATKTSVPAAGGFFSEHTGVNGTSIWAAATSSTSALQLQLLACMLARIWGHQEATAAWVELVQERRMEIIQRCERGEQMHIGTLSAARQADNISRTSLAEWDDSARAWLRIADREKLFQQKQLMLIISNLRKAVTADKSVFSGVLGAWKTALESMENLINGMPQAVNDGSVLIALGSWHIYPDLIVLGKNPAEVHFKDSLIKPGGVVTIGLDQAHGNCPQGVYWSLSLKHLHHYGGAAQKEALFHPDGARVTFGQFCFAAFGCLLGHWAVKWDEVQLAARFFVSIQKTLESFIGSDMASPKKTEISRYLRDPCQWWNIMVRAASAYLDTKCEDQETAERLVKLGMRRAHLFIPVDEGNRISPFFGCLSPDSILRCLKGSDERVSYLRSIAILPTDAKRDSAVIKYFEDLHDTPCFATVWTVPVASCKRKRSDGQSAPQLMHCRWVDAKSRPKSDDPSERVVSLRDVPRFRNVIENGSIVSYEFLDSRNGCYLLPTFGLPTLATICQPVSVPKLTIKPTTLEDYIQMIELDLFRADRLLDHILKSVKADGIHPTLACLSWASTIYRSIPDASVSLAILDRPLYRAMWADSIFSAIEEKREPIITRETALSCVAYMEEEVDSDPRQLGRVFAMAYKECIYITMKVLSPYPHHLASNPEWLLLTRFQCTCDPSEYREPYELRRLLGTIDPSSWKVLSTNIFNGRAEDHFSNTSVHLAFTDYYVPLHEHSSHSREHQVYFLESVASVHDSGTWVGDIDILQAVEDERIFRLTYVPCSRAHDIEDRPTPLVSAETWVDLLDPPDEALVFRANGNWIARLAAVAIAAQIFPGERILICPNNMCWSCTATEDDFITFTIPKVLIF